MTRPNHSDLHLIWQVNGDSAKLMERLKRDRSERHPRLEIHEGEGTRWEAQQQGRDLQLIRDSKQVPDPLIAFAATDVFQQADVFDSDAPCLSVGPAFIAEFDQELRASCHELTIKVVMYGSSDLLEMNRPELLRRARTDVTLCAVIPLATIKSRPPLRQGHWRYVPTEVQLPPFFRVPWNRGGVFVRDDIRHRIDMKLRGAHFNDAMSTGVISALCRIGSATGRRSHE